MSCKILFGLLVGGTFGTLLTNSMWCAKNADKQGLLGLSVIVLILGLVILSINTNRWD